MFKERIGKEIESYFKVMDKMQDKIQTYHESTTEYYNPFNELVQEYEEQINLVQNLINDILCCTNINEDYKKIENCNHSYQFDNIDSFEDRVTIIIKEFELLENLNQRTLSIRFL